MKLFTAAALPLLAFAGLASALELPAIDASGGDAAPTDEKSKGFLTGSLLPDGSVLDNVTLPSYDESLRLKASMLAKHLILHDRQNIEAKSLTIDFFSQNRKPSGTIQLETATYSDSKQLLRSDRPFTLISERLNAIGTGLIYDLKSQRGFVNGPVTADVALQQDKDTAMNTPRISNPVAIGVAMVAATAFAHAAPAGTGDRGDGSSRETFERMKLKPEEIGKLNEQAKSARALADATLKPAIDVQQRADADSLVIHDALSDFATHVAMTTLATAEPLGNKSLDEVPPPPGVEGPKTHITADDGAFMDRAKGILVFLKNVHVIDQGSLGELTGADELKVIFTPPPPSDTAAKDDKPKTASTPGEKKPDPTPEELQAMKAAKDQAAKDQAARKAAAGKDAPKDVKKDTGDFTGNLGAVQRVIATGKAVLLTRKSPTPDGQDLQASGRIVIYEPDSKELIIKGGSPWVVSQKGSGADAQKRVIRVIGENGYIRYNTETGESLGGGGQITGDLDLKPSNPDKSKNDKSKTPAKQPDNKSPQPPKRGH